MNYLTAAMLERAIANNEQLLDKAVKGFANASAAQDWSPAEAFAAMATDVQANLTSLRTIRI